MLIQLVLRSSSRPPNLRRGSDADRDVLLREAREIIEAWRVDYNAARPQVSLGNKPPQKNYRHDPAANLPDRPYSLVENISSTIYRMHANRLNTNRLNRKNFRAAKLKA